MNNVIRKALEELRVRADALDKASSDYDAARREYDHAAHWVTEALARAGAAVAAISELAEPATEAVARENV